MDIETFAHIVAHDLKAPLNGIASLVEFVVEDYGDRLDGDGRQQLELIRTMATRSVAMVDGLRQLSRLSAATLQPRRLQLDAIAPRLLAAAAALAPDAVVTPTIAADFPAALGDPALVPLVLAQLFANAVRFNERPVRRIWFGPVTITDLPVPDGHLAFAVRDDGIGVPDRHRAVIFDMFKRLHAADRFGGGVGSGLALARIVIERHGGVIAAAAAPDGGTAVTFTLPAAPAGAEGC